MPVTVPKKPSNGATLAVVARTARPALQATHLEQGRVLDRLLDVFLGLAVLHQPGLEDRGDRPPVLLADLHRVTDRPVDDQRLPHLGEELVNVDPGAPQRVQPLDHHRESDGGECEQWPHDGSALVHQLPERATNVHLATSSKPVCPSGRAELNRPPSADAILDGGDPYTWSLIREGCLAHLGTVKQYSTRLPHWNRGFDPARDHPRPEGQTARAPEAAFGGSRRGRRHTRCGESFNAHSGPPPRLSAADAAARSRSPRPAHPTRPRCAVPLRRPTTRRPCGPPGSCRPGRCRTRPS